MAPLTHTCTTVIPTVAGADSGDDRGAQGARVREVERPRLFGGSPAGSPFWVAVLTGSLVAASFAGVILRIRNSVYRRIEEAEIIDADADGIPDRYAQR